MNIQDTNLKGYKKLREEAKLLEPVIRLGKNGLTDNVIGEIKKQLKKRRLVKVKMLRSFLENKDKKLLANEIAERTGSVMVDMAGFVVVLCKNEKIKN